MKERKNDLFWQYPDSIHKIDAEKSRILHDMEIYFCDIFGLLKNEKL